MHHGQDCDALRFGPVHQKERIAFYENPASLGTVGLTGHGEGECASRSFLDCHSKPLGSFGLNIGVVLDFLEELGLCLLKKAGSVHEPVISRALAKTSSAGTNLASSRS